MEILLTGGTGYVGSAVLARLLAVGHEVTAAVRSDASATAVRQAGATPLAGDLTDSDWVRRQLETVQGAIHLAAGGDEHDATLNDAVIDAVIAAFGGTDKPFVHTGGAWTHGSGADLSEDDEQRPPAITAWRPAGEARLLAADVRASVIRPGIVYGHGDGIPAITLADAPREDDGRLHLVGSGDQHWTTVHVDELADLYLLVLDRGPGGEAYLGANGTNPTVRELGEAITEDPDALLPSTDEATSERFGAPFAEALLLDQQATGAKARALGWEPSAPSLAGLLNDGYPSES